MDIAELMDYLITPVAQVAIIIGLAEVIKRVGCPTRWIPLIDLGLGLLSGICIFGVTLDYGISMGIVVGLALGLSACGLFSGIKNTVVTNDADVEITDFDDLEDDEEDEEETDGND